MAKLAIEINQKYNFNDFEDLNQTPKNKQNKSRKDEIFKNFED